VLLPPKSSSFHQWALALPELAKTDQTLAELPYWLQVETAEPIPRDGPPVQAGSIGASASCDFSFEQAETQALLQRAAPALHITPEGVMLSALAWALHEWAGPRVFAVELEHHGRVDDVPLDLSRTVGWFTADFPLRLDLRRADSPLQCLRLVKDALNALPCSGLGFGLLASYHPDPELRERLNRLAYPAISFNYLGQYDENVQEGPLRLADENHGEERDPRDPPSALLDINGGVINGRLRLDFSYFPSCHSPTTMQRLIDRFAEAMQFYLHMDDREAQEQVLAHTDFPLAGLSEKKLKRVLKKINQVQTKETRV
jgi:non-ribosomal peptide synthase protein (TIGR01720 family)